MSDSRESMQRPPRSPFRLLKGDGQLIFCSRREVSLHSTASDVFQSLLAPDGCMPCLKSMSLRSNAAANARAIRRYTFLLLRLASANFSCFLPQPHPRYCSLPLHHTLQPSRSVYSYSSYDSHVRTARTAPKKEGRRHETVVVSYGPLADAKVWW